MVLPNVGNGLGMFFSMENTIYAGCQTRSGRCGVHNAYLLLLGEAGIVLGVVPALSQFLNCGSAWEVGLPLLPIWPPVGP